MFLLSRPSDSYIRTVLAKQRDENFSYAEVGASRSEIPADYAALQGCVELGQGEERFKRACEALRQWKMFEVPNLQLCWPDAPICAGTTVAIVIRHFGFWSINCSKIVYEFNEDGPVHRYGFAYGTLFEHAEQGEESFTLEWDHASDRVSYSIFSFSRPREWLPRIGWPVARWLQRRFIRDSLAAMGRATSGNRVDG